MLLRTGKARIQFLIHLCQDMLLGTGKARIQFLIHLSQDMLLRTGKARIQFLIHLCQDMLLRFRNLFFHDCSYHLQVLSFKHLSTPYPMA